VTAPLLGVKMVQAVWREREELLLSILSERRTIAFFMLVESTIELFHLVEWLTKHGMIHLKLQTVALPQLKY